MPRDRGAGAGVPGGGAGEGGRAGPLPGAGARAHRRSDPAPPDRLIPPFVVRAIVGAAAAVAIAIWARRAGALTTGGAVFAVELGIVATAAGWGFGAALVLFFLTSTALSRWRRSEKERRTGGTIASTGPRDGFQVGANGAVFTACALAWLVTGAPGWSAAAFGAIAAATADTWATEVGTLARADPRSVVTWRTVPAGSSGGVTLAGTLAALGGATFICLIGLATGFSSPVALSALAAGVVGAFADSLLGATLQSRRRCPRCDALTERPVHDCGQPTRHHGGIEWVDNDTVNFAATLIGAVVATILATR